MPGQQKPQQRAKRQIASRSRTTVLPGPATPAPTYTYTFSLSCANASWDDLDKFDTAHGQKRHAQKDDAMTPALNIGVAIRTFGIPDRQIHYFQVALGGTKEQIKIP